VLSSILAHCVPQETVVWCGGAIPRLRPASETAQYLESIIRSHCLPSIVLPHFGGAFDKSAFLYVIGSVTSSLY